VGVDEAVSGRRAVFLDRDGVLNRAIVRDGRPHPPATPEALEILPGVPEACRALRAAGFLLVVVTNQPDVARGSQRREVVEAMNARLLRELAIDEIRVCWHDDGDRCACRKPAPGLLLDAAREHGIDLLRSWAVGDRWRDVEAGLGAGCRTVFVDRGYSERRPPAPDAVAASLPEAVARILERERMSSVNGLKVKIFADGADLAGMLEMYRQPLIRGFTTNPTLMRKAGVSDYRAFAREVIAAIPDRPISFEVFSDEFAEMERQAHEIAAWGPNVNVKIPITNTRGESSCPLVKRLTSAGVKVNVTALFTLDQVRETVASLDPRVPAFVSVFAGRVADTGRDPVPLMVAAKALLAAAPAAELIWASPRELLNVFHAEAAGCDVITVTNDVLAKLKLVGKDLGAFSLETVKMFHDDAAKAGYRL
jgi:transaldolase